MKRSFMITLILGTILICSASVVAQPDSRENLLREIEARHLELQKLEKQMLLPSVEDREAYAEFLKQPDTGLTRLLPREIYDSSNHPEKRMTIHGGGSYFSFTRQTHEYGWGTQIGLEQGTLKSSFAGADYGMLVNLGEIPMENLNTDQAAVRFLASYEPASQLAQARSEYRRFADGLLIDEVKYRTTVKAVENNTYILRGIHYDDSDVLVAFRIVRKDSDGSIIIAWKLLKQYPKPTLARNTQPEPENNR